MHLIWKAGNSKVEPSKKGYATEYVTGVIVGGKSFFQEQYLSEGETLAFVFKRNSF
jgi:hypothetical protein